MTDPIPETQEILSRLVPRGRALPKLTIPLVLDEFVVRFIHKVFHCLSAFQRLTLSDAEELKTPPHLSWELQRDLITKRRGASYEVDALFYTPSGQPYLHIEAKADPKQVEKMAVMIDRLPNLSDMPRGVAKEIEYVLELRPVYFWLVGPGTVDPEAHVWRVEVDGLRARFEREKALPLPSN